MLRNETCMLGHSRYLKLSMLYLCIISDTSTLVNHEVLSTNSSQTEEIGLGLQSYRSDSTFYGRGLALDNLRSPSQSTTVSSLSTLAATPLDTKHRYHLFFAHHPRDKPWVEQTVQILEAPPYNYTCCYGDRDFNDRVTGVQNVLCSIMLSQRIVLVLSPWFLAETWMEYEDTIAHVTSLSQRRQRLVVLVLHDCDLTDSMRACSPLYVSDQDFWDNFFQAVQIGKILRNIALKLRIKWTS